MTTVSKLNILVFVFFLIAMLLLAALMVPNRYQLALAQEIEQVSIRVDQRADLQWLLFRANSSGLERILEGLMRDTPLTGMQAYTRTGTELASAGETGLPLFAKMRGSFSPVDTTINHGDGPQAISNPSLISSVAHFYQSLSRGDSRLFISVPVASSISPETKHLTTYDFMNDMVRPANPGTSFAMGYITTAINLNTLRLTALSQTIDLLKLWLVPVAVLFVLIALWNRRCLMNLNRLATAMKHVASGDFRYNPGPTAGREFRDMASTLSGLSDNLKRHEKEITLGRELLSRKVEERTHQLSRSHEELNRANEAAVEQQQQMQHMRYYDPLTSLPNRRLFIEQFDQVMKDSRQANNMLALLYLDVDNFRRINDTLGNSAGDLLLRAVAKRLRHFAEHSKTVKRVIGSDHDISVARMGGDEYTLILNRLDSTEMAAAATQKILQFLAKPIRLEGREILLKTSVGIAVYPGNGNNPGNVLNAAATAMHYARQSKRDSFLFFNRDMVDTGGDQLQLEGDLRQAIENEELSLHYQPQIDTVMGSVVAIEALLRWQHPDHGDINPDSIVSLAEEIGLIDEIGNWVLETACNHLKALESRIKQLPRVAINVASSQLTAAFAAQVESLLQRSGLAPDRLELSLAEPVLTSTDEELRIGLARLRELGVYLSLDGYGRGQSSLLQLSRFPLDEMKLERDFIADFRDTGRHGALLSLITTAHSLGLKTCAEGVEHRRDYEFLAEHGVKQMQGYLFSKPVSLDKLVPLLAPWHFSEQIRKLGVESENNQDET